MKKTILQTATGLFIMGSALFTQDVNAQRTATIKDTAELPKTYSLNARKNLVLAFNDSLPVKNDTLTQWQQFKAQSEEKIEANEKRIIELKTTATSKEEKMKENYKNDENGDWQSFKQKFNKEIDAVTKSIRSIKLKQPG